jgi:hypothetical protein
MANFWRLLTRRRIIKSIVVILILRIGWWGTAYPRGMIVAWYDLALGDYKIKGAGYPAPEYWEYRKLLQERYGVQINAVAGCVVDEELDWYIDGYNSISSPRIKAHFGENIFEECSEEARVKWEKDHPKE